MFIFYYQLLVLWSSPVVSLTCAFRKPSTVDRSIKRTRVRRNDA